MRHTFRWWLLKRVARWCGLSVQVTAYGNPRLELLECGPMVTGLTKRDRLSCVVLAADAQAAVEALYLIEAGAAMDKAACHPTVQ